MMKPTVILITLAFAFWCELGSAQPSRQIFAATIDRKVDSLLALMTLEEKAGQLNQLAGLRAASFLTRESNC